jgi:hypothetical protein
VDLEVVLAQHERDGRGGKGHANRNGEDGVVGDGMKTARAQGADGDGREWMTSRDLAHHIGGGWGAWHLRGLPLAPWPRAGRRFVITTGLGLAEVWTSASTYRSGD